MILIVGQERLDDLGSERWDVRLLTGVEEERTKQRTRLAWEEPLGHMSPHVEPAGAGVSVYVFRQRAALFGHNAPDPRMFNTTDTQIGELLNATGTEWLDYAILGSRIDLDGEYAKVVPGSWIALVAGAAPPATEPGFGLGFFAASIKASPVVSEFPAFFPGDIGAVPPSATGYVELYHARSVIYLSRRDYGLSAKTTHIDPDTTENLDKFGLRETLVLAQSEPLPIAETPLGYPLYGDALALSRLAPGIGPGRALALSGKRARLRLSKGKPDAPMPLSEGGSVTIREGDSLRMLGAPEQESGSAWVALSPAQFGERLAKPDNARLRLWLLDRDGNEGLLSVAAAAIELAPAEAGDKEVQEIAFVGDLPTAVDPDRDRTSFTLAAPLKHCYDSDSARVNANVARATHGETVNEILGSGDARVPNASFRLRQAPLTFVSAATASGRQSTLALRANDLLWAEVDSLYARGPAERVYEIAIDDEARTTLRFGDGRKAPAYPLATTTSAPAIARAWGSAATSRPAS